MEKSRSNVGNISVDLISKAKKVASSGQKEKFVGFKKESDINSKRYL